MADDDTFLDVMQADVVAVLSAVPALADAVIITDDEGDLDSKVTGALKTRMDSATGKRGLVVVVLRPEVIDAETNLPGPPMEIKSVIQTIEQVMYNRDPVKGTLKTASQAALNVLASLHLRSIGSRLLFARKNPISSLPVIQGHLSRGVTLYAKSDGIVAERPPGVSAQWNAGTPIDGFTVLSDPANPMIDGFYAPNGELNGRPLHEYGVYQMRWDLGNVWWEIADSEQPFAYSPLTDLTPPLAGWIDLAEVPAAITVTEDTLADPDELVLTTASGAIYYTTDGTFPTVADGTLYTVPITGLEAGTVVRAAAYDPALGFGDLLELTITA